MKKILVGAVVILSVTGCATQPPKVWYKEGATDEQFRRDQMSCRQYGMQSAMANGLNGNMFVESFISKEARECLIGLGYQ